METLFRLASRWPLSALHALGWLGGWLVFLASATYRRRFLGNVAQAGIPKGQWLAAVGQSGMMVAELPRLWLGRPVLIQWEGAQHVEAAIERGQGILFLTPHLGCFEVTAQALAERFGARQPLTVLYRPPRKTWIRELVAHARRRPGLITAPTTTTGVKQMLKALRAGQSVGLLPDQVPPHGLGVWAPFFGRSAYTMTLSARLAQQTGASVLVIWGERLAWGRGYRVMVSLLGGEMPSDPVAAATLINESMAGLILGRPGQYLWGYERYKHPRETQMASPGSDSSGSG